MVFSSWPQEFNEDRVNFFYKIEHVVLFTAWNQQTQTLFKLRNIPSSVESFSLSFFKEVLKSLLHFSPVWHSTVCQANDFLLNQILKYLLLFAFSLLRWLHLYAKIFWNIFELFSPRFLQVQRSRMVSPVNFFVEHSNNFKRVKHKNSSSFVHTLSSMTWA